MSNVCVCFVLCEFVSGLILWLLDNLCFDDSCAESIGDILKLVLALMSSVVVDWAQNTK